MSEFKSVRVFNFRVLGVDIFNVDIFKLPRIFVLFSVKSYFSPKHEFYFTIIVLSFFI